MGQGRQSAMLECVGARFPRDLEAAAFAAAFVRVLQDIHTILDPILGVRGVAALLQRSLSIAHDQHPWLADPLADAGLLDMPALQASLARQDVATARAAAFDGVLRALDSLLVSLIGSPLTERLFEAAWSGPYDGNQQKEITP